MANGEYVAYDSDGRLLLLEPQGPIVRITEAEQAPTHQSDLRHVLTSFMARVDMPVEALAAASLGELVDRARRFQIH